MNLAADRKSLDWPKLVWLAVIFAIYAGFWWYVLESAGSEVYGFRSGFSPDLGLMGLNQAAPFLAASIGMLGIGVIDEATTLAANRGTGGSAAKRTALVVVSSVLLAAIVTVTSLAVLYIVSWGYGWTQSHPNFPSVSAGLFVDLILIFVFLQFVWALTRKWYWSLTIFVAYALAVILASGFIGGPDLIGFGTSGSLSPTLFQGSPLGHEAAWQMRGYWLLVTLALLAILAGFDCGNKPLLSRWTFGAATRKSIWFAFIALMLIVMAGIWGVRLQAEKRSAERLYTTAATSLGSPRTDADRPIVQRASVSVFYQADQRKVVVRGKIELHNDTSLPISTIMLEKSPLLSVAGLQANDRKIADLKQNGRLIEVHLGRPIGPKGSLTLEYNADLRSKKFDKASQALVMDEGFFLNTLAILPLPRRPFCTPRSFGQQQQKCLAKENYQMADRAPVEIIVDVPSGLEVMNAIAIAEDGDRTRWRQLSPPGGLGNVLVAAGRFTEARVARKGGTGSVSVYLAPHSKLSPAVIAKYVAEELDAYSAMWGRPPMNDFWLVEVPNELGSAVAYLGGASVSERYLGAQASSRDLAMTTKLVVSHEIAHQWWGYAVVPKMEPGSALVIEAFAQFGALRRLESRGLITREEIVERGRDLEKRYNESAIVSNSATKSSGEDWNVYYLAPIRWMASDQDNQLMPAMGEFLAVHGRSPNQDVSPAKVLNAVKIELPPPQQKIFARSIK